MFKVFFCAAEWFTWAWGGILVIFAGHIYKVSVDVWMNNWFGNFYNALQRVLAKPDEVSESELYMFFFAFARIAGLYMLIAVVLTFFVKHWTFRWRQALTNYYISHWTTLRLIEGASQRVQEDTKSFARGVESLGASCLQSLMRLIAFIPVLWGLENQIKFVPLIGVVDHELVHLTVIWAVFGTGILAVVGIRLPGLEFKNQLVEAAYRKELVHGEDDADRAEMGLVMELFLYVRTNYFTLFRNFLYMDLARQSYLQFGVLVPYLAMTRTIAQGGVTLGQLQQIVRAFGTVTEAFQLLLLNWDDIVVLMSIYKRLVAFEAVLIDNRRSELAQAVEGSAKEGLLG